jgi:drug/metabolite transporter (DMT)-like permease
MATLRLTWPHDSPTSSATDDAPPESVPELPAPIEWLRPGTRRIRLDSLRTPLWAVVREQSQNDITIAAELPWLAIGTVVHAASPDGTEFTGHVQSFDVEVTSAGSARLLIRADLGGTPAAAATPRPRRTRLRWSLLVGAVLLLAGALGGYALAERSVPSFLSAMGAGSSR